MRWWWSHVDTVVVAGGLLRRAGGAMATPLLEKIVAASAPLATPLLVTARTSVNMPSPRGNLAVSR